MNDYEIILFALLILVILFPFIKYFCLLFVISVLDLKRLKNYKKQKNVERKENSSNIDEKRSYFNRMYFGLYKYVQYKVSLLPSRKLRLFLYKHVFHMNIGKNVVIHYKTEIRDGFKITIGDGTIIGDNVLLDGRMSLEIGKNVNISSNASIYTLQHDPNCPWFSARGGKVVIKDRAWVSSNTMVLPNVVIGEGAVLAAAAVCTKSLEDYTINAGIPAKPISKRNTELLYEFKDESDYIF